MKTLLIAFILATLVLNSHCWLTCPISLNRSPFRKENSVAPCEAAKFDSLSQVTPVYVGDRLKVGWVSNNRCGGYVRLALVPLEKRNDPAAFDMNVVKYACFGHDERFGEFQDPTCNHPCNARGGCEYQTDLEDVNRYDTTIAIPTNLDDGLYVLQWKAVPGTRTSYYYSCAVLHIQGGSSRQHPCTPARLKLPACARASEGLDLEEFVSTDEAGAFCYDSDNGNDVDHNIGKLARNYMCDPRQSCVIASSQESCQEHMVEPKDPFNPMVKCPGIDKSSKLEALQHPPQNVTEIARALGAKLDVITILLPPPIFPFTTLTDSTTRQSSATRTSSSSRTIPSTPRESESSESTTTSTSSMYPGGACDQPIQNFYCFNGNTLIRCVNHKWVLLSCPHGAFCEGGRCIYETSTRTTFTRTTETDDSITSTSTSTRGTVTIRPHRRCRYSEDRFFCYDSRSFARCVYGTWIVQSCAPGTTCLDGACI